MVRKALPAVRGDEKGAFTAAKGYHFVRILGVGDDVGKVPGVLHLVELGGHPPALATVVAPVNLLPLEVLAAQGLAVLSQLVASQTRIDHFGVGRGETDSDTARVIIHGQTVSEPRPASSPVFQIPFLALLS